MNVRVNFKSRASDYEWANEIQVGSVLLHLHCLGKPVDHQVATHFFTSEVFFLLGDWALYAATVNQCILKAQHFFKGITWKSVWLSHRSKWCTCKSINAFGDCTVEFHNKGYRFDSFFLSISFYFLYKWQTSNKYKQSHLWNSIRTSHNALCFLMSTTTRSTATKKNNHFSKDWFSFLNFIWK